MTVKATPDFQHGLAGWDSTLAEPGCLTVLPAGEVPAGCPLPYACTFTALVHGSLRRPRSEVLASIEHSEAAPGLSRYYAFWTWLPSDAPDGLIFTDFHASIGTNPLRVEGGRVQHAILAGERRTLEPGGRAPRGWWPWKSGDHAYAFERHDVVDLAALSDVADRWTCWWLRMDWRGDDRGRARIYIDRHLAADSQGPTLPVVDGAVEARWMQQGAYLPDGPPGPTVFITGTIVCTRMAEARHYTGMHS